MSASELRLEIEDAFRGVVLDGGISLKQTDIIDNYCEGMNRKELGALPSTEITDDWRRIPKEDLARADALAFLDAKGFRYYIPALMLFVLDNYDSGSMVTISTLSSLYPKNDSRKSMYAELSLPQLKVIAIYVRELPNLVNLDGENRTIMERADRNYWSNYLDESYSGK
jgi:hypothetical protein